MKQIYRLVCALSLLAALSGCLASTSSPVGVNCDFRQEKPLWEMPSDCENGR